MDHSLYIPFSAVDTLTNGLLSRASPSVIVIHTTLVVDNQKGAVYALLLQVSQLYPIVSTKSRQSNIQQIV